MQFQKRNCIFFLFKNTIYRGGKNEKKSKINQILEMPREIDNKEPKITIISFDEIFIENYKGILEYEEFFVKIGTEIGTINVNGYNLMLEQITEDDIGIKGIIKSIDLEKDEEMPQNT